MSGDHRDLHSFPTRRSSDLGVIAGDDHVRFAPGVFGHHAGPQADLVIGISEGADRKSTRLNSSHTVISYAVFCLKKKK